MSADPPPDPNTPPGEPAGIAKGLTHYGDRDFSLFLRKAFVKGAGYSEDALQRPVIGMTDTGSAYNPCHGNMPQLLEALQRGILLAGGLPMPFPTVSLHESFAYPTSMYLRNLMSMDTEEMLRAQPMDAVVLVGGCDKTVPAQLMGAASAGAAGDPADHRLDADRLVSRRAGRRLHRLPALLGALSRTGDRRRGHRRGQPATGRQRRHLLRDGHGQHHGLHRRGAGHDGARRRLAASGDGRPHARGRGHRRSARWRWRVPDWTSARC